MSTATRDRRPRGPITDYNPTASTRALLDDIGEILEENRAYWPLTVRAVYYRLLGRGYPKSAGLAGRVSEHVSNARRAGWIDWAAISDQNETRRGPVPWEGTADEYAEMLRRAAANVEIDQQEGQPERILVWTEAAGMVPMLANAVGDRFGVDVISTSGYDSTTVRHNIGREIARDSVPWTILHIGDHDPDGRAIFRAMAEDVEAWAEDGGGSVEIIRLAVTPEQIADMSLPDDPTKPGSVQAEAIPPDVLVSLLVEAIQERRDDDAEATMLERQADLRRDCVTSLGGEW